MKNLGLNCLAIVIVGLFSGSAAFSQDYPSLYEQVYPGVWCVTIGEPESITPVSVRSIMPAADKLEKMPSAGKCPVPVRGQLTSRGLLLDIPLESDELIYGLGLQLQSFQHRGSKKITRVNADPVVNTGDSHAPVPFYVTSRGYGILVDNARYITFYFGNKKLKPQAPNPVLVNSPLEDGWNALNGPYERLGIGEDSHVIVEIPRVKGVRVYVFEGPTMKEAVARYNLFSGGGFTPPRWGLGFWYRVNSDCTQDEMLKMASYFRVHGIPCDVLGLEPHWQTNSYSSSYVWSSKFPDPASMLDSLRKGGFRVNMWMQAFVHPKSPVYKPLLPWSGDYEVWNGLVPDFLTEEAQRVFIDYHRKANTGIGIAGFKADECDNSDYTGNWSFPEFSVFPSGADGEQMHSLFGIRFQDTIYKLFQEEGQRTYNLVRSSGALASPYPFVLYSDLYDHQTFINAVAQSGFSGLQWAPEVRHAVTDNDLVRRLQTAVFSPLTMVNGWYLKLPPWIQRDRHLNNQSVPADNAEELESVCCYWIEQRMKLIPYLQAAYARYEATGVPPFRPLILDYPEDREHLSELRNQFMMGDHMMVAPAVDDGKKETTRKVYLPEGEWYNFYTGEKYEGGRTIESPVTWKEMPVFVKSGTLLPLAKVTGSTDDPSSRELTVRVYGDNPESLVLCYDEGPGGVSMGTCPLKWNSKKRKVVCEGEYFRVINTEIIR